MTFLGNSFSFRVFISVGMEASKIKDFKYHACFQKLLKLHESRSGSVLALKACPSFVTHSHFCGVGCTAVMINKTDHFHKWRRILSSLSI